MIPAILLAYLLGTALGSRYKVAILLPAMVLIAFGVMSYGVLISESISFILTLELATLAAVQFGFLSTAFFATSKRKYLRPARSAPNR